MKLWALRLRSTDGVIQKYEELQDSIDEVILKKKAEAVQSAMQAGYEEAINGQTEAYINYAEAQKNVEKTTEELRRAQKKQQEIQDKKIHHRPERLLWNMGMNCRRQKKRSAS